MIAVDVLAIQRDNLPELPGSVASRLAGSIIIDPVGAQQFVSTLAAIRPPSVPLVPTVRFLIPHEDADG